MSRTFKWLFAVLLAITVVSLLAVAFMAAHRPDARDEDEEETVKTPSRVVLENGRTVIRLSAETQAREGIQTAPLREVSRRTELRATAVLLPAEDLAAIHSACVVARAKLRRDQVGLNLARTQAERVKKLYDQNQNMSLQAMQDSEAAYRATQAQVAADQQELTLQLDTARQRWGPVVAGWMETNSSPLLTAVLRQRAFLAQVIFPPGEVASPPARLSLTSPDNHLLPARLLSALPQVNSQIQGLGFLYFVSGRPGMASGMNLLMLVPVGHPLRGSVVPETAVVWWQGKAWAYEQISDTTFVRREVPADNPVSGGYFVPGGVFAPQTKLVTAGGQELLSEEFRSHIQQED